MNGVICQTRLFFFREGGATAVEYGLMLALIVVVCYMVIRSLGA
jgi:Flp pilus assembly pilin Flp